MVTREPVPPMTDIEVGHASLGADLLVAGLRSEIAALAYTGPESVQDAATLRERSMAMVDLARRAGVLGIDHLLTARESERGLGQMLLLGRAVGDIRDGSGRPEKSWEGSTITNLGIEGHLAADALVLASLDDDEWAALAARARESEAVTRSALVSGAKQIIANREAIEHSLDSAATRAAELQDAANKAAARLDDLLAKPYVPIQPVLTPDELRMDGVRVEARAVAESVVPERALDESVEAKRQRAAMKVMRDLTTTIEHTPAYLTDDVWTAVNVLAARETVGKLTDALAAWLRALNTEWKEYTNG